MLKLAKLTDYGIVLLSYMSHHESKSARTARDLSEQSGLPLPTVSKVLKTLSRSGLLVSHRGKHGGYSLSRSPEQISVADMLEALEGRLSLTDCATDTPVLCDIEPSCPVRSNWKVINRAVYQALSEVKLSDMTEPMSGCFASSSGETKLGQSLLDVVR